MGIDLNKKFGEWAKSIEQALQGIDKQRMASKASTVKPPLAVSFQAAEINTPLIAVNSIAIDHNYQRPLTLARARAIAKTFDPSLFGTLTVVPRDGKFYLVDGQHRYEAAKLLGIAQVPCNILAAESSKDEAGIFRRTNANRSPMARNDDFRAALHEGDPIATDIDRIVREHDLQISLSGTKGRRTIGAVAVLYWVYEHGGERLLSDVLTVIRDGMVNEKEPWRADLIKALATVLEGHRGNISLPRLMDRLSVTPLLTLRYQVSAFLTTKPRSYSSGQAWVDVVTDLYNDKLRKRSEILATLETKKMVWPQRTVNVYTVTIGEKGAGNAGRDGAAVARMKSKPLAAGGGK